MSEVTLIGLTIAILSIVAIVYPHVLYPAILMLIKKIAGRPFARSTASPPVAVVISVFNEASRIEGCLRSIAASSYAADRFRIVIGDDGSTDDTVKIIERLIDELSPMRIEMHQFSRSGKNSVLSSLVKTVSEQIVVFTDADTIWEPDALAVLLEPFASEDVGAVLAQNQTRSPGEMDAGARGDAAHRGLDDRVNTMESMIASTVWSSGPLYAVRRSLLTELPNTRVADDWYHCLQVIQQGKRVLYHHDAIVHEVRSTSLQDEVRRTVRTASSGMATLWWHRRLLLPTAGWPAFFLWSHRLIRWLSPVFLVTLLFGTVLSVQATAWFGFLFYGQFALYALALLGYAAGRYGQHVPIASLCAYFVAMNGAFVRAMFRFVSGARLDAWTPDGGGA